MCAKYILTVFIFFSSTGLFAQTRFGVDINHRMLNKPVDAGILHHFIQARNYTGDTLQMRWKKYVYDNPPAAWLVNFADPQQNHSNIKGIDSADFILPDSSNWVYNKFVIGIDPNDTPGFGRYIFTIFERNFPNDSLQIEYEVFITPGLSMQNLKGPITIFPNPARHFVYLQNMPVAAESIQFFNSQGQAIKPELVQQQETWRLNISNLPKGTYYLSLSTERKLITKKIIIH